MKSIQIFQLIDFGTTFRRWTARCVFCFHVSLRFENAKRSQKQRERGNNRERQNQVSEWERRSNFYAQKNKQVFERVRRFRHDWVSRSIDFYISSSAATPPRYLRTEPIVSSKERYAVYRNPKLNTKNTSRPNIASLRFTHRIRNEKSKAAQQPHINIFRDETSSNELFSSCSHCLITFNYLKTLPSVFLFRRSWLNYVSQVL